jgi:hypothetical protein
MSTCQYPILFQGVAQVSPYVASEASMFEPSFKLIACDYRDGKGCAHSFSLKCRLNDNINFTWELRRVLLQIFHKRIKGLELTHILGRDCSYLQHTLVAMGYVYLEHVIPNWKSLNAKNIQIADDAPNEAEFLVSTIALLVLLLGIPSNRRDLEGVVTHMTLQSR